MLTLLLEESRRCGVSVIYCTHIFDGLEGWATHMMHLEKGQIKRFGSCEDLDVTQFDVGEEGSTGGSMFTLVKHWLSACPPPSPQLLHIPTRTLQTAPLFR